MSCLNTTTALVHLGLVFTPVIAGIFGIKGKMAPDLLAKITLATEGPLLLSSGYFLCTELMKSTPKPENKSEEKKKSATDGLLTSYLLAWLTTGVVLSILALQGKVNAHQLGWGGCVGPFIGLVGFSILSSLCKETARELQEACGRCCSRRVDLTKLDDIDEV